MSRYTLLLLVIALLMSCDGDDGYSTCLDQKIADFKSSQKDCVNATIIKYDFKGQRVFAFSLGQCIADGGTSVYDEDCQEVCFLGGIAGFTECDGETFADVAREVKVIWRVK